ncbi:hypothetical protein Q9G87_11570 [Nonomuraea sp. G32]|nr:hypothetical protein [Nonomuraea sp. G32]MDP4502604.1 hypothetical protein [Nonomuraea sp. G32]
MQGLDQCRAVVEAGQCLVDEGLQVAGGVLQGRAYAIGAGDGDAVAAEHQLGVERGHPAEGGGPLDGVALHLLRVAGVRGDAEKQVAREEDPLLGEPADHMVVCLAPVVGEFKAETTGLDHMSVGEGDVRFPEFGRPDEVWHAELTAVDEHVIALRFGVTPEAREYVVVRDHLRARHAAGIGGVEGAESLLVPEGEGVPEVGHHHGSFRRGAGRPSDVAATT